MIPRPPRRPAPPPVTLPRWGWVTLGLMTLGLLVQIAFVVGARWCRREALEFLLPRLGQGGA